VEESTNNNLVRILKKTIAHNQRNWHNLLHNALWADRVTPKESIGNSQYFLVYGHESILPNELYLPSLQLAQDSEGQPSSVIQKRIDTLLMLEEEMEMINQISWPTNRFLKYGLTSIRLKRRILK
jgi:hypothetical protein